MLDYKKLNNYLIGLLMKDKKVYYGEHEDKIILSDSYALWILEKDKIFINLQLCVFVPEFYKKFIPDDYNYFYGYVTDTIQITNKCDLRNIINKDENIDIQFDNKYYKLWKDVNFKIISDNKPILIYIDEEINGLILPVKRF